MLSCKEVCYIVSKSLDAKLPWHKRLKVSIHLLMCKACQRMVRQIDLLRAAARRYGSNGQETLNPEQETLSQEASARILARLHQAENDPTDHV